MIAPRGGARRRAARRRRDRQRWQASLPARLAEDLQGRAPRDARGQVVAGARGPDRGRPLRSPSTPTATRSPSCRPPSASCRGAHRDRPAGRSAMIRAMSAPGPPSGPSWPSREAAGRLSRRSGRGGGTTLPGRMLLRMAPDAIARLGAGSRRHDDRQRHQRQDHDRRDARLGLAAAGRASRSTTAPART